MNEALMQFEHAIRRIAPNDYPIHEEHEMLQAVESTFNHIGSDGWELVSVMAQKDGCWLAFFKRQKPEPSL